MTKITLNNVGSLIDATTAQNTINANNAVIQTAFDNTLSRDGTAPNQMNNTLDMNSMQIVNLPTPATANSPLRLQDLTSFIGGGIVTNIPSGGTTGQVLGKNSNTNFDTAWKNSVTSVGLALPSDLTVTNSPVTTTGTLTGAWATTPTGTGAMVRATSPTLVTPALGAATATTLTVGGASLAGGAVLSAAGNLTSTTGFVGPGVFGGTAANSTLSLSATTNVAPSGDVANVLASTINLKGATVSAQTVNLGGAGGGVTVNIATPGDGLNALNVYNNVGSKQTWVPGGGATTVTFPTATDTLVGKATTDTLTNKTLTFPSLTNPVITGASPNTTGQLGYTAGLINWFDGGVIRSAVASDATQALTNKTYNGNAWTAGSGTLTLGASKTLTSNNTLTLAGTDGSTLNAGVGGTLTGSSANAVFYDNIPQNSQSAAYTLVLSDAQKHLFHPSADTTARTWTIPANASVAYPIGTAVTFVNQNAGGVITIAITTDTMRLAGAGTTGSRTLAANGIATALKVTATEWIISGTGLT